MSANIAWVVVFFVYVFFLIATQTVNNVHPKAYFTNDTISYGNGIGMSLFKLFDFYGKLLHLCHDAHWIASEGGLQHVFFVKNTLFNVFCLSL